jgi:hypothetical protein
MRLAALAALALVAVLTAATPAAAQDDPPAILEVREAWTACTRMLEATPDGWVGWRRNFDGGYADFFEFHDGGDDAASVLVQTWLIDAIAIQKDTSCYRRDGSLAFVFSELTSPNMAADYGPSITREGRIYYAPDGAVLRILGSIKQDGEVVAETDNEQYQLARGCELTHPHLTLADVRRHLDAELGTLEGTRPEFTGNFFAWCNDERLNQ